MMSLANNSLNTNFNTSPYYDDFDQTKNYHRILFKPGQAVQARELTQLQTILQNQIDRFGSHVFREGSIVIPGQYIFDTNYRYIQLSDVDTINGNVVLNNLLNLQFTAETTQIRGVVNLITEGSEASVNKKTIYVKLLSGGNERFLQPNEILNFTNGQRIRIINNPFAIGSPTIIKINEGVLFAKDHFIRFPEQEVIVSKYSSTPSVKVGFEVTENIVDFTDDSTLLDPAQGSYNFNAPGADRLQLVAEIKVYDINDSVGDDFFNLFLMKNGVVEEKITKTQYSLIADELARRTFDESGHYFVNGLNISIREHLDTGSNGGLLAQSNGGNNNLLAIGIDPGKAYVSGYEIETLVTRYVETKKGLDFKNIEQDVVTTNYGSYMIVNELVGNWNVNIGDEILFYDTVQQRISAKKGSTPSQVGNIIGSAKFKNIESISVVKGYPGSQYKIYLYDIVMTSGSFPDVKNLFINNSTTAKASADVVLVGGKSVLYDPTFNKSIYKINSKNIKSIRDENNNIDTTYSFVKTFNINIPTNGVFSLSTGAADEILNYSVGNLNSDQKTKIIVTLNSPTSVNLPGTVTLTSGSPTVTGVGTFFTRLNVGDKLTFNTVSGTYYISAIGSNTSLTLSENAPSNASGVTYTKNYFAGDVIDYNLFGATTGAVRTISVDNSSTMTFNLNETLNSSISANVNVSLNKIDAREARKILRRNRYVQISTAISGTSGPFNLGISDIIKIKEIRRKTGSSFTTLSEGSDVTESFILDNGQRDTSYENGRIIRNGITLGATDFLLVKLDYFEPDFTQGSGYFSVDSYPVLDIVGLDDTTYIRTEMIPTYKSSSNEVFNLRDSIDMRPIKSNTANNTTNLTGITTSPAISTTYVLNSNILRTPQRNENFRFDYSFYLRRKDIVTVDKNGFFKIVNGVPSVNPVTPPQPVENMTLAVLDIAPYPSLSNSYANDIKRLDLSNFVKKISTRRSTMKDIDVLKDRIENIEYYQMLSLLEKQTKDMLITDENGLDRFKNGIFVDPFRDHSLGNPGDPAYRIAIDPQETCLRSIFESESVGYDYISGSNIVNKNNVIMLNYNEAQYINQPFATSTRNAAGVFWNFKGSLSLDPDQDFWTDTTRAPDLQVQTGPTATAWQTLVNAIGTQWNSWQTTWSGTNLSTSITQTNTGLLTTQQLLTTEIDTRTRTNLNISTETQINNIGERVIDVSAIPFIRPRPIRFSARGMQPNTKVYAFFDGESVSNYVTLTNSNYVPIKNEGEFLETDSNGNIFGIFRIPNDNSKRFKVGSRIFRLTDSLNNGNDVITSAEKEYTASGFVQNKQTTFLTTTNPTFNTSTLTETRTRQNLVTSTSLTPTPVPPVIPPVTDPRPPIIDRETDFDGWRRQEGIFGEDPIGQTFTVSAPDGIKNIFITSVDLFFATKHPNLGVDVELREVDSAGQITNKVIPYSQVYIPSANINVSTNGQTATNIQFKVPVCLITNTECALVIRPEQNNPNTRLYTAKLGEKDIVSGNIVSSQPLNGNIFISSNNKTFSAIQDEDLKLVIYRASFNQTSGSVTVGNKPREVIRTTNKTGSWTNRGNRIYGETRVILGSIVNGPITVGMRIVQGSINVEVTNINGNTYRLRGNNAENITVGPVTVNNNLNVPTSITANVNNIAIQTGYFSKIEYDEEKNEYFTFEDTTYLFEVGEQIKMMGTNDTMIISSIEPVEYSVINFEPSLLNLTGTKIVSDIRTTDFNNVLSSFETVNMNDNTLFKEMKRVLSRSQEISLLSGQRSLQNRITLESSSNYVSPVIDINRTFSIVVNNLINNDVTNETNFTSGNAWNKYISKIITLRDGNDAEDLNVFLTAYRPPNTDIKVYVKLLNGEDSRVIENINWLELVSNNLVFSSIENENDYRELKFILPNSVLTGPNGEFRYVSNSITYTGFRYFMIKIILISSNPAIVPKVGDARCIALQI